MTVGDKLDLKKDVTASDKEDGDLTKSVEVIENNVPVDEKGNVTKEGSYTVTYKVTDSKGASSKKKVTIKVNRKSETINAIPKITAGDRTLTVGDVLDLKKDVTASDVEDGDLTKAVEVLDHDIPVDKDGKVTTAGSYTVTYKVTDSKKASSTKKVTITVNPKAETINAIPKITAGDQTLTVGDPLNVMKDVTATDTEDGDLTAFVKVPENNVPIDANANTTTPGSYTITYTVTDSKGATSTKTVTVTVNPKMETINQIPVIKADDQTLAVGDAFDPLKDVTAVDTEDGNLTTSVEVIENNVPVDEKGNVTKEGSYTVTYRVTDSQDASSTKTITVTVNSAMVELNHIPTISASDQVLTVGDPLEVMKDVSATDDEDGDLTAYVKVPENTVPTDADANTTTPGSYTITYTVTDTQGASSMKTVTVIVNPKMEVINQIPQIQAEDQELYVGDSFDPLKGVIASDTEDGDIMGSIEILENNVPVNEEGQVTAAGTYSVTYTVKDSQGASAVKTIQVTVKEKTKEQPEKEDNDHPTENGSSSKTTTKENTESSKQNRGTRTSTGTYALVYGLISAGALLGIIAMVLRYKRSR